MSKIHHHIEKTHLFEELAPMALKRKVVVIGRFQPPTKGHYGVIGETRKFINKNKKLNLEATPAVIIIEGAKSSADKKRNPLTAEERISFMKASGKANGVDFFIAKNAFDAFKMMRENGFEPIAVAAGSDRIGEYMRILDKYFTDEDGKPIEHYSIPLTRDADAVDSKAGSMDSTLSSMKNGEDVETDLVSGSLARRAVELGYEPEFAAIVGLEDKPALARKMFAKIAAALGV